MTRIPYREPAEMPYSALQTRVRADGDLLVTGGLMSGTTEWLPGV